MIHSLYYGQIPIKLHRVLEPKFNIISVTVPVRNINRQRQRHILSLKVFPEQNIALYFDKNIATNIKRHYHEFKRNTCHNTALRLQYLLSPAFSKWCISNQLFAYFQLLFSLMKITKFYRG